MSPGSAIAPPWGAEHNKHTYPEGVTYNMPAFSNPFRVREKSAGLQSQGGVATDPGLSYKALSGHKGMKKFPYHSLSPSVSPLSVSPRPPLSPSLFF
jgi:hypothetical protein